MGSMSISYDCPLQIIIQLKLSSFEYFENLRRIPDTSRTDKVVLINQAFMDLYVCHPSNFSAPIYSCSSIILLCQIWRCLIRYQCRYCCRSKKKVSASNAAVKQDKSVLITLVQLSNVNDSMYFHTDHSSSLHFAFYKTLLASCAVAVKYDTYNVIYIIL